MSNPLHLVHDCFVFGTITLAVALQGCSDSSSGKPNYPKAEGPTVGHWEELPSASSVATGEAFGSAMVVTDSEFLSWSGGGGSVESLACNDENCQRGFALNLETKLWRVISVDGAPQARVVPITVWTGEEMMVWGGMTNLWSAGLVDGGAYNPKTDTWRIISSEAAPSPRRWLSPIWTGKEVILWGGADFSSTAEDAPVLGDGAAYNPVTDSWRSLSTRDAPSARCSYSAVWTGVEMLVWGGTNDGSLGENSSDMLGDGFAYNPETDSWRTISTKAGPERNIAYVTAWTGTEMLLWGGSSYETMSAYNPSTDSWRDIDPSGPHLEYGSCSAWTGKYLIKCGAEDNPTGGALYDPHLDRWSPIPPYPITSMSNSIGFAYHGDMISAGGLPQVGGAYDLSVFRFVTPK